MRFVTLNMLFAIWLMLSAFVLPHSATSWGVTFAAAVVVGVVALASHGRPALRFIIPFVMVLLALLALFLEDVPGPARLNNAIVAAILFTTSVIEPKAATPGKSQKPQGAA